MSRLLPIVIACSSVLGAFPAAAHPGHGSPGLLHWMAPEHLGIAVLVAGCVVLVARGLRGRRSTPPA
jgi:hypothetical protein